MLAVFDVLFILTGGLFIIQLAFRFDFPLYNRLFPYIIYPVAGISMTGEFEQEKRDGRMEYFF